MYNSTVREDARNISSIIAEQTFNSMFQLMRQGWNRDQVEQFIKGSQDAFAGTEYALEIYRGPVVEALFGKITQSQPDSTISKVFANGHAQIVEKQSNLRYLYPLLAKKECLRCHTNAKLHSVLGVIDVTQNLDPVLKRARQNFMMTLAFIIPVALLAAIIFGYYITKKINYAIFQVNRNVANVNNLSDLTKITSKKIDLGFDEFNSIFNEFHELIKKLKTIAVDKDLLEFEIRLIEKFIITSEVVRDWRDYINKLLLEINNIIDTYAMFSIFKMGEDSYELEIFWRDKPKPVTQAILEGVVKSSISENEAFSGHTELIIKHNIANPGHNLAEINENDIIVQTKALLVDMPKIGGIVGIGVQSDTVQDPTRVLVMESVLSTLLNVVGSVKAIYRFTKDLEYYATRDPLTDLYNQRVFWELLEHEIGRAERGQDRFTLLMIDFDNFKSINDTYGHSFGDQCLQEFSDTLKKTLRKQDILARYGGDEFVIILPQTNHEQFIQLPQKIREQVNAKIILAPDGSTVKSTVSIGIAAYPDHAIVAKDLFLFADNMMYKAKSEGKDKIGIPNSEDMIEVFKKIGEKGVIIKNAIDEKRAMAYFQPLVNVQDGHIEAYEVLCRIQTPDGNIMGAGEFIETAEQLGVIHKLDLITIEKTFATVSAQNYNGYVFLNLSPKAMVLDEFLGEVKRLVRHYKIDQTKIVFEITERESVKNISLLKNFLFELKLDGFLLAIDDFGSGFSSFQYLKHFPVDFLKIEGEFIANILKDKNDYAFVKSISTLAKELDIRTVAEYVEDAEILAVVKACGIDLAQGYHVGKPSQTLAN